MMPRKKRRTILIVSIILLILIIVATLILLYILTDMFKSSSTLFAKYMGQNVENIEAMYNSIGKNEYNDLLQQNKYTTETQIKINYAENIGTSSESTQNSINQLKLEIDGQTDKNNQYNYQDIRLLSNDEQVSEIEYTQSGNTYGIKFSDIFNQYILVNNENLKGLFEKAGYTEKLENIPDTIEFNNNLESIYQFSEEEKQNIKTKYLNIINSNISKENFSKQKNQVIQIDGKNINANSYIMTVTKEQLNNLYIKILEELKQDEMILSRIDQIQALLENYQTEETMNLRERFIQEIESLISDITRNNIGQDEAKITVYENNKTTISTIIEAPNYEIYMDVFSNQTEDYLQVSYKDMADEKEQVLTYKKTEEETSVILKNAEEGTTNEYSLIINQKIDGNQCVKNIVAKYEYDSTRVEAVIDQNINIVDEFEQQIILDNENSINLSELEAEQVQAVLTRVNEGVSSKINEITTTTVSIDELLEVLKSIGLIKEGQSIEATGVSETERNRFNSKFEILQGENLDNTAILNLIDAIKDNLIDIEVVSNTELKLKLDRLNKSEEVATTISTFIEERKNKKYNAKVEYDEETGLVSAIVLTMLET